VGVDVELIDERGNTIERVGDPDGALSDALPERDNGYEWLSSIDPWANTVFNSVQMPRLLPELERRAAEVDAVAASLLWEVRRLAVIVREEAHLYLKFVGD
jgi:hypothetical protein